MTKEERPLTARQIAKYCHVTQRTVVQWINDGKIKAYRTPGNHSRVTKEDFIRFLNKYNMPVPDVLAEKQNHKPKVLIVDDEKKVVSSIKRALQLTKKYDLDVAYDGFAAGQKFISFKPDVVILDIQMPGVDGYEVCSNIRSTKSGKLVKIIIISGAVKEDMAKIKKIEANGFIKKPFSNEELIATLEKFLKE